MAVAKYIAFAAFIILAGTGIAVGYTGASLLTSYVAYLSPWVPAWLWIAVSIIMGLGVGITATSTVGAITTLAPKPRAFKICLSLLLSMVVTEIAATVIVYQKQHILCQALSNYMDHSMKETQVDYGTNLSDTQLWDEIQLEMNCCGVDSYKDWFPTDFGNGTDVPDSCCLVVEPGCGKNIASSVDPGDYIITEGCRLTVIHAIGLDYHSLSRGVWLPVCAMHVALMVLLVATAMFLQESYTASNLRIYSVSAVLPANAHKYQALDNNF
ncbi:tetraspanin-4-like [Homarus americanus]|uniref:tetraspanin-4-like n=1 Tax=Homarus americanus TaxID=6706 RepID=UPI001C486C7F|nr:tetraspanin-4-like [Homarus americanus]XP_042227532.1 tetraspanin-4-like [Homarus americanus]XP_042227533.1 tetraspanin-4-like [Homarus americanus]XP_042227534.1 tetraspanin-4-like [Homarus americanus]XP_042227535.1 tetraspanin-4-like [Homarus americanus]XP_042227536.1 tetraspanin-4-like [Homarus americanus]XP_042227537.1 tetraspanin-4-like [Homarus americanus]XP_042227538.1 tetraspanin-4-like [Homarus americanus]XP_042227539.1 tetraspanin-4-like [Homarus americanus]XP_042227540.1 tetra